MPTLTSACIKNLARRHHAGGDDGADIVGIAPIERFANAPEQMHPKNIFPDCRSVISIIQPIPRSTYRGITTGTYWPNYTFYAYNRLNTLFRPMVTYEIARGIEDHGFEAVPVYPGVPEHYTEPKIPGRPAGPIDIQVRIAAMLCGLGEIGWSKVFLHKTYGPRVRIGTILTDAVLEPDAIVKPGTLCKRCMQCVKHCPGNAIPTNGEKPSVKIEVDGNTYEWGDVHMGRCTATHHGINWKASPFLKRYFPGWTFHVAESDISEELAYKFGYTLAGSGWKADNTEFPSPYGNPGYRQMMSHGGYFAICGAKGCIRACMNFQEKTRNIEQKKFETPVFPEEPWSLPPPESDETGGIVEKKGRPDKFQTPDPNPGGWD